MKYLFVFLLIGLVSCGDDATGDATEGVRGDTQNDKKTGTSKQPNCDEIEWIYETIDLNGLIGSDLIVDLIEQGQIHHTGTIIECDRTSGKVKYLINYKDGKRDGVEKGWYDNGQLFFERHYKDGLVDGLYRGWYDNGKLESEFKYKNDMAHGLCKTWEKNSELRCERFFKDDELISEECFDGLGNLIKCCFDEEGWQIICD